MIALVGDGAFQMNGMNELITIAKYRERWSDPRLIVLVLHNNDLNQVTWEQRALRRRPEVRGVAGRCPTSRTPRYAELLGFEGIRVDAPDDVGAAWDEALAAVGRCSRGDHRSGGAAAAAAHHARAGEALLTAVAGDPDARRDDHGVAEAEGRAIMPGR